MCVCVCVCMCVCVCVCVCVCCVHACVHACLPAYVRVCVSANYQTAVYLQAHYIDRHQRERPACFYINQNSMIHVISELMPYSVYP